MNTRYPSNHDVRKHQQHREAALRAECHYAEYDDTDLPAIDVWAVVGRKSPSGSAAKPPVLLQDHAALLRRIALHPADGLRAHYEGLGISIDKGNRILRHLVSSHFVQIEVVHSPLKPGRPRKVPHLTPTGQTFIEAYDNTTH